jgi:hypothetical protein
MKSEDLAESFPPLQQTHVTFIYLFIYLFIAISKPIKCLRIFTDIVLQMYDVQRRELCMNEDMLLQTLGFQLSVDLPHPHVVSLFSLVRGKCLDVTRER